MLIIDNYIYGERINIDLDGKSEWICSKTGDKYFLDNENLIRKKSKFWD